MYLLFYDCCLTISKQYHDKDIYIFINILKYNYKKNLINRKNFKIYTVTFCYKKYFFI